MNISVITSYPEKSRVHAASTVGGASYAKILLSAIKKQNPKAKITVFAEKLPKSKALSTKQKTNTSAKSVKNSLEYLKIGVLKLFRISDFDIRIFSQATSGKISKTKNETEYTENGIKVVRIWKRNDLGSLIRAIDAVYKKGDQSIFLSFEVFMFGNPLFSLTALIFLTYLRLITNRKTYVLMHQVVGDFRLIYPGIIGVVLNICKTLFYKLVSVASTNVIVFEEHLKTNFGKQKNVSVIPHIVTTIPDLIGAGKPVGKVLTRLVAKRARKQLGLLPKDKVVLCFGYLAPYKGLESLVELWPKPDTLNDNQPKLILAGGINPNHKDNQAVVSYVEKLQASAAKNPNITMTGFVDERDITTYFSAADSVIIPYKTFLSSSGPLALALAHAKPVIFAEELRGYAKTDDIAKALNKANLSMNELVFKRTTASLVESLALKTKKAVAFAKEVASLRSEQEIAKTYLSLFRETKDVPRLRNPYRKALSGNVKNTNFVTEDRYGHRNPNRSTINL